ncbi:MAG: flotillin domain-containing protein [Pseudomonadota bacterium]
MYWDIAIPIGIGVILILAIGFVFASLYRRSTRDEAFVRTGLGGQKVILDGGSLVLPVFHSVALVNLKTLRLEVARGGPDSLITKDRMRVDIGAEFYVRVKPDTSSIALAAQTLGNRSNDTDQLRQLVEAKFVDGLRSVAATMALEELQEQRAVFVKSVQEAVGADIQNNGLELESVSLTKLDQSDIKHFNPNNFFDAHGLTTLTKITKEREQERNQIVRSTEVAIAQQDLVARQTTLTIESTKREAELAQQRDIANRTAAMRAETEKVEQTARQNEAEYRIGQELAVANKQTDATQARETKKIEADLAVKRRNIEAERELQIATQESAIIVATKSKQQSEAQTIAETARALAISAEEKVKTAQAVEVAERDRTINVTAARKAAETNAMPITVTAEAERQAADNKAEATRVLAKADAEAAATRAAGVKALGQAEAEVAALKAEARNRLSQAIVEFDLSMARLKVVPEALAEAVKPIEKISDIRIFDTGGMLGRGVSGGPGGIGLGDGLAGQLLSVSALKPMIDRILAEAGFPAGPDALTSLTNVLGAKHGDALNSSSLKDDVTDVKEVSANVTRN